MLERLSGDGYPHIVPLLTTYRHSGHYCLLFDWANGGDLLSLWRTMPNPLSDKSFMMDLEEQLKGIASGLGRIHTVDGRLPGSSYYCTHKDLKPANILVFEDSICTTGRWMICDFGLSSDLPGIDPENHIKSKGWTRAYRHPECDLNSPVSSKYGTRSLGCVFMEAVMWVTMGWSGVVTLGQTRTSASSNLRYAITCWHYVAFSDVYFPEDESEPATILHASVLEVRPLRPLRNTPQENIRQHANVYYDSGWVIFATQSGQVIISVGFWT